MAPKKTKKTARKKAAKKKSVKKTATKKTTAEKTTKSVVSRKSSGSSIGMALLLLVIGILVLLGVYHFFYQDLSTVLSQ